MYVYMPSEPGLYTVGFYIPGTNDWMSESDWPSKEEAANRVHWLNGGDLNHRDIPPRHKRFVVENLDDDVDDDPGHLD
jgi:hypothetical protein